MNARPAVALALESSTRAPSVALATRGVLLEERTQADAAHASDLLPAVARLLERAGLAPRDVTTIAVGIGPGSYTGLRVGAATALGLARGTGAELRGISSSEALAYGALIPGEMGWVVVDARSNELYCAHFLRTADDVECLRAPCVTTAAELDGWIATGARVLADEAAVAAAGFSKRTDLLVDTQATPLARHVLELAQKRLATLGPHAPHEIEPLYLRAFAAKSKRR